MLFAIWSNSDSAESRGYGGRSCGTIHIAAELGSSDAWTSRDEYGSELDTVGELNAKTYWRDGKERKARER